MKKIGTKLSRGEANLVKALESLFPKKSTGGQLLATAASFIPGFGPVISPVVSMVDGLIDNKKAQKDLERPAEIAKVNQNPFGKLALGGGIQNAGFKQYNTGSHLTGNDQTVNEAGVPNGTNPVASIQNKENMFMVDGKPFVMSDVLINPKTGNTINIDAAKLNKKLDNAAFDPEQKNALKFGMKRLATINDSMKMLQEATAQPQMYEGGPVPRRVDPLTGREYNLIADAPQGEEIANPLNPNIPAAQNPLDVQTFKVAPDSPWNSSFNPSSYEVSDPANTAEMYTASQYPNNKQIGQETPLDFGAIGQSVASGATNRDAGITQPPKKDPYNNWANKVAIGLKGVALAKSFADTLRKAEVEDPILPNYEKSDRYMQEANIDYTQARQDTLGASNIGANINRSASNNFSSFQGREQARVANLMDSLGRVDMQEGNARSQLNLTRGQYEQGKAIDTANRLSQNRIDNFQNLATDRLADEKFFTELSQVGTEFNKYNNFRQQLANNKDMQQFYIKEGLMMINQGNPNFKVSDDFVERMQAGATWDELVQFYPDDAQAFAEGLAKSKSKTTTTTKTTN